MAIIAIILSTVLASIAALSLIPIAAYAAVDFGLVSTTSLEGTDVRIEVLGPVKFDEPNQVLPYLANGTDYTFNVSFFEPNSAKPLKDVNYNIVITNSLDSSGNELFNAAKQANSPNNMLHSANGNVTIKYNFKEIQSAIVVIQFYGTNSAPSNQQHEFIYQVVDSRTIPEFPLAPVILASSLVTAIVVRIMIKRP